MAERKRPTRKLDRVFTPTGRDPHCTRCDLCYEMRHNVCVWGSGPETGDIMLVGIMPGIDEDHEGRLWVGKAGEYLRDRLEGIGLDLDDVYSTNVLKCMLPRDWATGGVRKASPKEVKACAPYLMYEIKRYQPKVIVAMGDVPIQFFTGQTGVGAARGGEVEIPQAGVTVMPTYNPAYFVRNKAFALASGQEKRFLRDIKKARAIARGKWKPREMKVTVADTPAKVKQMFEGMRAAKEMVVDIETTGPEDFRGWAKVYCIGVCFEDGHAWALPWNHPDHPKANEAIRKRFIELLHGKTVIGHKVKFDMRWMARLYRLDIWKLKGFWDTRLAAHLVDENYPEGHRLRVLVRDWVNAPTYAFGMKWSQPLRSFVVGRKKIAWDDLLNYCGMDAGYTWLLKKRLAAALENEPGLEAMANTILFPSARAFCQMELNGIGVDEDRLLASRKEIKDRIKELQADLIKAGLDVAKMSKKSVVIDWVSGIRGHLVKDKTPRKKKPSIARATLLEYSDADPAVGKLLECQELMKLLDTYLGDPDHPDAKKRSTGWVPLIHDGRLYPRYEPAETVTGLTRCEAPNVQHVPSDRRVRGVFCAPEGWSFLEARYNHIKLRVAAAAAKDKTLMANDSGGPHVDVDAATQVPDKPVEQATPDEALPDICRTAVAVCWAMGRLYDSGVIRGLGFEPPSGSGILRPDEIRQVALIHGAMLFEVRDDCVEKYKAIIKAVVENQRLDKAAVDHFPASAVAEVRVYKVWSEEVAKPRRAVSRPSSKMVRTQVDVSLDHHDSREPQSDDPSGLSWVGECAAQHAEEHGVDRTDQVTGILLWLFEEWEQEDDWLEVSRPWRSQPRIIKALKECGVSELEARGAVGLLVDEEQIEEREGSDGREYRLLHDGGDDGASEEDLDELREDDWD